MKTNCMRVGVAEGTLAEVANMIRESILNFGAELHGAVYGNMAITVTD